MKIYCEYDRTARLCLVPGRDGAMRRPKLDAHLSHEPERGLQAASTSDAKETPKRHECRSSLAFTLIEVVISAALMAVILTAAYLCLSACIQGRNMVEPRADTIQTARVAMALLTADLRDACSLSPDAPFLGMQRTVGEVEADNLDFATHNYTPRRPNEGDFCEVSYYVEQDPDGSFSLWRRRNPTLAPDPLSGGSKEEIADNLLGVRFEYFDGLDWYDDWGDINSTENGGTKSAAADQNISWGLPEAVRITLMLDSHPEARRSENTGERVPGPPLVFQTVAYLNLADAANGGSTATSSQDTGDQSGNGGSSTQ